jgi:hypothetical protein
VDLLDRDPARGLLEAYARARRLVDFGNAALSRKLDDASEVARVTGTSIGNLNKRASLTTTDGELVACGRVLISAVGNG